MTERTNAERCPAHGNAVRPEMMAAVDRALADVTMTAMTALERAGEDDDAAAQAVVRLLVRHAAMLGRVAGMSRTRLVMVMAEGVVHEGRVPPARMVRFRSA